MGELPEEWRAYQRRNHHRQSARKTAKPRHKRRRLTHYSLAWGIVLMLAAGVWFHAYGLSVPSWDRIVGVPELGAANSVSASNVIDGDTVRTRGETFRLVGFDTPETGRQARCAYERELASRATARLQTLTRDAAVAELFPVQCSCRPGTHGTSECNFGRSCGTLLVDGRDVDDILISEGLARSYVCGATSCPQRRPWC